MAKTNKEPTPVPATPAVKYEEQLPEVTSVGMTEVKGGWVAFILTTQGDKVVDRKILSEEGPEAHTNAFNRIRVASATEFLFRKGDLA